MPKDQIAATMAATSPRPKKNAPANAVHPTTRATNRSATIRASAAPD
jgi:hypothetical protein